MRDEVYSLEDETMPTKKEGESTRQKAFAFKFDTEGVSIETKMETGSSSSRYSFVEETTLSRPAVDLQAMFASVPPETRPSAQPQSRELSGIPLSTLREMGGLSVIMNAIMANGPSEMEPFMEAQRKTQREQESKELASQISIHVKAMTDAIADAPPEEASQLIKTLKDTIPNAPPETWLLVNAQTDSRTINPVPTRSLDERAMTSSGHSTAHLSADDADLGLGPILEAPQLPPRPHSSVSERPELLHDTQYSPYLEIVRLGLNSVDMAFKNLKVDSMPELSCSRCEEGFNNALVNPTDYCCRDCGDVHIRPLCERCNLKCLVSKTDPHQTNHTLQTWSSFCTYSYAASVFEGPSKIHIESRDLDNSYGKQWSMTDHSFTPFDEAFRAPYVSHKTRWLLNVPPGKYNIYITLQILRIAEVLLESSLNVRQSMAQGRNVPQEQVLGQICYGASSGDLNREGWSRYPPLEYNDFLSREITNQAHTLTLDICSPLVTTGDQPIEIFIRGFYSSDVFRTGSPFRWRLETKVKSRSRFN